MSINSLNASVITSGITSEQMTQASGIRIAILYWAAGFVSGNEFVPIASQPRKVKEAEEESWKGKAFLSPESKRQKLDGTLNPDS